MRRISQLSIKGRRSLFGAALLALLLIPVFSGNKVSAACNGDSSDNANIRCGFSTPADFVSKVRHDSKLQALYNYDFGISGYGLSTSDYANFANNAVSGTTDRSGNITVGGHVVATGARSIGRLKSYQGSNPSSYAISGAGTFWGNTNNQAFASGTNSLKIYALFDKTGKLQFAVMPYCGNQSFGTPTSPPVCKDLSATKVAENEYNLTTSTKGATNGETVAKVVYSFTDGRSDLVRTVAPYAVNGIHLTKDTRVTARIYVNVPGGGQAISSTCETVLNYTTPQRPAVSISKTVDSKKSEVVTIGKSFSYGITVKNIGNQTLTNVKVTDPAPKGIVFSKASAGTIVKNSWTYVIPSLPVNGSVSFTITASMPSYIASAVNQACVDAPQVPNTLGTKGDDCDTATVTPMQPSYTCDQLTVTAIQNQQYTYTFTAHGSFTNGAQLIGGDFDFGDNQKQTDVTKATSNTVTTTHSYNTSGSAYNVSATLHVRLPNGTTVDTTTPCTASVKVASFGCIQLTGQLQPQALTYQFTVSANATQDAKFQSVDFNFGDNTTANDVAANGLTASTNHTYAADGDYTITATLHFMVNNVAKTDTCTASISQSGTTTPQCQPGVPQGSSLCSCAVNPSVPANSPDCKLPNTGAGDVIGIAGVATLIGFFLYRQFIYRKHVFHTNNAAINTLLGETPSKHEHKDVDKAVALHKTIHERNHKPLSHGNYHRPHRFRPRSHDDHK